jgi:hypothetical protein
MKTWKVSFEISISDCWIEDGFDMKERKEQLIEFLEEQLLPYSYSNEVLITKMEIDEINS